MIRLRRPSWFAVVLTLAGMALFIRLGVWQLHRASEKEQLLRLFAAASTAPLEDFAKVESGAPADRYPHVAVRGRYVPGRVYFLDDQVHGQRLGVDVYAPFRPDGRDRLLLVDLGFLQREGAGPDAPPHLPPMPKGEVTLKGIYAPPPGVGMKMGGNALQRQKTWPKTVVYIDLKQIGADLGATLYPRRLLLDPKPATTYLRQWTPGFMPPARHRGYAFQWFSFAVASLVIFLILHRRRDDGEESDDER